MAFFLLSKTHAKLQWIGTVGVLDQAVRGLIALRKDSAAGVPPRSPLLDIFHLNNSLMPKGVNHTASGILPRLALLSAAAGAGTRLVKEWRHVLNAHGCEQHNASREQHNASREQAYALAGSKIFPPFAYIRSHQLPPLRLSCPGYCCAGGIDLVRTSSRYLSESAGQLPPPSSSIVSK